MVWYSHLLKNFPQFIVIHTVKGFSIVNKAEVDVFLELSCFVDDLKDGLKLYIQKTKIMVSGPITSWQIDGETVETVSDFIFGGSKITADGDCRQSETQSWRYPSRRKVTEQPGPPPGPGAKGGGLTLSLSASNTEAAHGTQWAGAGLLGTGRIHSGHDCSWVGK